MRPNYDLNTFLGYSNSCSGEEKNSLKAAFYLHNAVLVRLSNALQVKLYDSSYSPLTVSHVYESIPIHIHRMLFEYEAVRAYAFETN